VAVSLGCHVVGGAFPKPSHEDTNTILLGIRTRISRVPPTPGDVFKNFTKFVDGWIKRNFKPLSPDVSVDFEDWIKRTGYSDGRCKELRDIYEKIDIQAIRFGKIPFKYRRVKCFVKDEAYATYKHARGIWSRSDAFKCLFGPFTKAIEDVLYTHPSFIKHVPVANRGRYIYDKLFRRTATYIATDYTAFESHFTSKLMAACENRLYKYLFSGHPERKMLCHLLKVLGSKNSCSFKRVNVTVPARRMSGEMNTSLGNGFTNLMVFLYVQTQLGNSDFDCVVEGDDLLGTFKGTTPTSSDYASMGFNVKIETHQNLNEASFCGLIFDPSNYVVVPDPFKIIMKTGWTSKFYRNASDKTKMELLRSKALSCMHQYPGVPIVTEFSKYLLRVTEGHKYKLECNIGSFMRNQFSSTFVDKPVEHQTRELMSKMFKFDIPEQLELESFFRRQVGLKPLLHPAIDCRITATQRDYDNRFVVPDVFGASQVVLRVLRNPLGFCLRN